MPRGKVASKAPSPPKKKKAKKEPKIGKTKKSPPKKAASKKKAAPVVEETPAVIAAEEKVAEAEEAVEEAEKELSIAEEQLFEAEAAASIEEEPSVEEEAPKKSKKKVSKAPSPKKKAPSPKKSKKPSAGKKESTTRGKKAAEVSAEEEFDPSRPCESEKRTDEGFYSVATLKALARIRGIPGFSGMKRPELCAALRASAPAAKAPSKKAPSAEAAKKPSVKRSTGKKPSGTRKVSAKREKKEKKPKYKTVLEVLEKKGGFSTFLRLLNTPAGSQAKQVLERPHKKGARQITVFAPTDEAFAKIPKKTLSALEKNPAELQDVLGYHIVGHAALSSEELLAHPSGEVEAINGRYLPYFRAEGAHPAIGVGSGDHIGRTTRKKGEKRAENGVVHYIDAVLIPPAAKAEAPVEVKKPTPKKKPTPSKKPTPKKEKETKKKEAKKKEPELGTLSDVVHEQFHELEKLLDAADLSAALREDGELTLFAPSDAALKEAKEEIEVLLQHPDVLKRLLSYHVVPKKLLLSDISKKIKHPTTLEGEQLKIQKIGKKIYLGKKKEDITVVAPEEVLASNGVVHSVSSLLIPAGMKDEIVALLAAGMPAEEEEEAELEERTVYEWISEQENLSEFLTLVNASGLTEDLQNTRQTIYVMAPTNRAIQAIPDETLKQLVAPAHKTALKHWVETHISYAEVLSKKVKVEEVSPPLINGKVYIIDRVLAMPKIAVSKPPSKTVPKSAPKPPSKPAAKPSAPSAPKTGKAALEAQISALLAATGLPSKKK